MQSRQLTIEGKDSTRMIVDLTVSCDRTQITGITKAREIIGNLENLPMTNTLDRSMRLEH